MSLTKIKMVYVRLDCDKTFVELPDKYPVIHYVENKISEILNLIDILCFDNKKEYKFDKYLYYFDL